MKKEYFSYYKPKVLIGLIVIITTGLLAIKIHWGIPLATIVINTAILGIISTKLWSRRWIRWMFWVDDISGRYEGNIEYQFIKDGEIKTGTRKHIKVISQNGYRLQITSFTLLEDGTPSSPSNNIGMYISKTNDDRHFELVYSYLNNGNPSKGFQPHFGTDNLKVIVNADGEHRITGNYYTDRDPQTRGTYIELKKTSNNLDHEF